MLLPVDLERTRDLYSSSTVVSLAVLVYPHALTEQNFDNDKQAWIALIDSVGRGYAHSVFLAEPQLPSNRTAARYFFQPWGALKKATDANAAS